MAIIIKDATIKSLIKGLQDMAMLRGSDCRVFVPDGRDYMGEDEGNISLSFSEVDGTDRLFIHGVSDMEASDRSSEVN